MRQRAMPEHTFVAIAVALLSACVINMNARLRAHCEFSFGQLAGFQPLPEQKVVIIQRDPSG